MTSFLSLYHFKTFDFFFSVSGTTSSSCEKDFSYFFSSLLTGFLFQTKKVKRIQFGFHPIEFVGERYFNQ